MNLIKKFARYGAAVSVAALVGMTMIVGTAQAAGTVTATGTTAVPLSSNLATGNGTFTALGTAPVITFSVAGEAAIGETIVLTAPAGFQFDPTVGTTAETGTIVVGNPVYTSNNSVATATVTTANGAGDTVTFNGLTVRPIFANTVGGTIAVSGTADATGTAQTLTVTARTTPFTFGFVATPNTSVIAADGTQSISFAVTVTDGGAVTVNNTPVTFTAALGGFGTTGAQTTTISTNNAGVATVVYKGLGTAGVDTIVAEAAGQVGTTNVTLQTVAPAAGTPTTLTGSANRLAIGASNTTLATPYTSPNATATVTFRLTDAAGTGVNGRQVVLSTNIGRIAAVGACSSASGTSVVVTTTTVANVTGRAQADVCLTASTQVGDITVTGRDVQLSSVTGTLALTAAGPAATANTTWNNGVLTVSVVDAGGRRIADGTGIQVTLPANTGAVSPAVDTASVNGQVQFAIALTAATGNAIVTVRDSVGGTIRVNTSVNVTASTGGGTTPAPSTGGFTGTIAPSGVSLVVFGGGTVAQLAADAAAAGATTISVTVDGAFKVYVVGAPAFVNAGFPATLAANTPVILKK